tara:strand:+ start:74 stop:574 length:501 start_codon:yes stop_codon:yes gene_type:complete
MADLGFHLPSLIVYLVNFTILLVVLYMVGYKPILNMLDQRTERIRESVEMVDKVREESAAQQAEMQKQMEEGRQEGQAMLTQAREIADKIRDEATSKARLEADDLVSKARESVRKERDEAIEQVRQHFAELAILAAERVIDKSLDGKIHQNIIDKVLDESADLSRS